MFGYVPSGLTVTNILPDNVGGATPKAAINKPSVNEFELKCVVPLGAKKYSNV